jgi:chemotaxis protein CheZ
VQRKQFRIESMLASEPARAASVALTSVVHDGEGRRLAHGAAELASAMEAIESACQVVLGTAERVDDNARALAAAADDGIRALAQEIREQMARIFEVCHFQDLAGQRITKVIDMLTGLDERLSGFAEPARAAGSAPALINGPRLDGASGHVSQDDVDALFG